MSYMPQPHVSIAHLSSDGRNLKRVTHHISSYTHTHTHTMVIETSKTYQQTPTFLHFLCSFQFSCWSVVQNDRVSWTHCSDGMPCKGCDGQQVCLIWLFQSPFFGMAQNVSHSHTTFRISVANTYTNTSTRLDYLIRNITI